MLYDDDQMSLLIKVNQLLYQNMTYNIPLPLLRSCNLKCRIFRPFRIVNYDHRSIYIIAADLLLVCKVRFSFVKSVLHGVDRVKLKGHDALIV